ncbi:MAG TPA: bifunctional diguanylate cyclase/phosphodiesterase [Burkholderiaceae bacterium]|nr:bifunctional diguanylate cyclase/phosphodiesterase [Burkholderiaceae bacterium]
MEHEENGSSGRDDSSEPLSPSDIIGLPAADIARRLNRLAQLERVIEDRGEELQWVNERLITELYERQAAEESVAQLRVTDAVTGLPNRVAFERKLERAAAEHASSGAAAGVVAIGIEKLSKIRDALGLSAADIVARQLGERLRAVLRGTDVLARIGDNEFGLVLSHLRVSNDAGPIARKLIEAIEAPLRVDGKELRVTAAIGVSVLPEDGSEAGTLLARAGAAMQFARENGMRLFQFFNPAIGERGLRRLRIEAELRTAIEEGQFGVQYLPRVNIRSRRIVANEALVRWYHPERGPLGPVEFLDVAEETGLIVPIGMQVLRRACEDATTWPKKVGVQVNLSPREFRGETLLDAVDEVLASTGLEAHRLQVDITEVSLGRRVSEVATSLATIAELRGRGVRVALDDFGSGACSLTLLHRCRVDMLKIDGGFVRAMGEDIGAAAVVRAIAGLGRRFGARVIAEGVETESQLEMARKSGCVEAQGFLFGQPAPAAIIARTMREADRKAK